MEQPKISNQISSLKIRQIFIILIMVLFGGIVFWELKSFLPSFFGAYTLYILLRKAMLKLTKILRGWRKTSAMVLIIGSFLIILVPLNGLINILSSRVVPAVKQSNTTWATIEQAVQKVEQKFNIAILTKENFRSLGEWGMAEIQTIVGSTFNSLFIVMVMYFILFFMLIESENMEKAFYDWLPLRRKSVTLIKKNLNDLVFSNAIGIPLVALLQGLVALLGYYLTGVPEPFLWFVVTCVAAILPVMGAALVYIPLVIVLFSNGMVTQSVILLLYGLFVISTVDNLFRFWVQDKIGDTHPLITIFGVIVGIQLFGFMGLIFGPILIALLLLLTHIYKHEFHDDAADV